MDIQCEFTSQQPQAHVLSKIFCLDHSHPKQRTKAGGANVSTQHRYSVDASNSAAI